MHAAAGSPEGSAAVVVVGLGPAGPGLMTVEAREAIDSASTVLVRTSRHPAAEPLVVAGARPLDAHYERAETFAQAYAGIVEEVVETALRCESGGHVAYCVPGSPYVLESSVVALRCDPRVTARVVPGMSFLDLAWARLGVDPVTEHVRLVDAGELAAAAAADHGPLLVAQLWSRAVCSDVKLAVETAPDEPVVVLHHLGLADERVETVAWDDLDRIVDPDHLTCMYVPSLAEPVGAELVRLAELVRVLRERCPWDREQTHASLARHLLEETYELLEAIEEVDDEPSPGAVEHLEEELGDVLCQVYMHSTIASGEGLFNLADVARSVHDKLVHRHPHVFGDGLTDAGTRAGTQAVRTAAEVLDRWEQAKKEEKGRASVMDGIPASLPALLLATKLERKASAVGLGWDDTGVPPGSTRAALDALQSGDSSALGELLLAVARAGAHLGADPEQELRRAAQAMRARFATVEGEAAATGGTLTGLDRAARRELWMRSGSF
ncbi:MAG: MazG family protein [Acidimicrobiales bacterium]